MWVSLLKAFETLEDPKVGFPKVGFPKFKALESVSTESKAFEKLEDPGVEFPKLKALVFA